MIVVCLIVGLSPYAPALVVASQGSRGEVVVGRDAFLSAEVDEEEQSRVAALGHRLQELSSVLALLELPSRHRCEEEERVEQSLPAARHRHHQSEPFLAIVGQVDARAVHCPGHRLDVVSLDESQLISHFVFRLSHTDLTELTEGIVLCSSSRNLGGNFMRKWTWS